jgi:uncharacterized protein
VFHPWLKNQHNFHAKLNKSSLSATKLMVLSLLSFLLLQFLTGYSYFAFRCREARTESERRMCFLLLDEVLPLLDRVVTLAYSQIATKMQRSAFDQSWNAPIRSLTI